MYQFTCTCDVVHGYFTMFVKIFLVEFPENKCCFINHDNCETFFICLNCFFKDSFKPLPVKKVKYEFFDPGNHWCRVCNIVCSNLTGMLQHLHGKKHQNVSADFYANDYVYLQQFLNMFSVLTICYYISCIIGHIDS